MNQWHKLLVQITPEQYKRVRQQAMDEKLSIAEVVRQSIDIATQPRKEEQKTA